MRQAAPPKYDPQHGGIDARPTAIEDASSTNWRAQEPWEDAFDAVFSPAALGLDERPAFADPRPHAWGPVFDPILGGVHPQGAGGARGHLGAKLAFLALGIVIGAALTFAASLVLGLGQPDDRRPPTRAWHAPVERQDPPVRSRPVATTSAVAQASPALAPQSHGVIQAEPARRGARRSQRSRRARPEAAPRETDRQAGVGDDAAENLWRLQDAAAAATARAPAPAEAESPAPADRPPVTIGSLLANLHAQAAPPNPAEEKVPEDLPSELSLPQLQHGLARTHNASRRCFQQFKASGAAHLRVTIRGRDGRVVDAKVGGELQNSQTGRCLVAMARGLRFSRFSNAVQHFSYPLFFR